MRPRKGRRAARAARAGARSREALLPPGPATSRVEADAPPLAPAAGLDRAAAWLGTPLGIFLISRAWLLIACYLGLRWDPQLAPDPLLLPLHDGAEPYRAFPGALALDGWVRWDSAWYHAIVQHGYAFTPGQQSSVAFFPLYPLLSALLAWPLRALLPAHQAFYLAALVLSQGAFYLALLGVWRVAEPLVGRRAAQRALWLLCLFPYAFFFSAAYTEALYLALVVWALYLARLGRWPLACALAALASATRSTGVLLLPLLGLEHLRRLGWRLQDLDRRAWWLLLAPAGLLAFIGYQWLRLGNPLAFVQVQAAWQRSFALPNVALMWRYAGMAAVDPLSRLDLALQLVLVFALPIGVVLAWRRCGWLLGAFCALSLLPALTAGSAAALGRFTAVVFPLFIALAPALRRRWLLGSVALIALTLQLVLTYGFSHWRSPV
ncbi:MAG: hypothetical protein IPL40_08110 [Proteobacteria bacterium]|nr:hypothetical protein [Pseudomonadota bacterium]